MVVQTNGYELFGCTFDGRKSAMARILTGRSRRPRGWRGEQEMKEIMQEVASSRRMYLSLGLFACIRSRCRRLVPPML